MKRKVLGLLFILAFSSIAAAFSFTGGTQSNVLFYEDFDSSQMDSSAWEVQENTNLSGYPAYGGLVNLTDGHLALSSNGSTFPWVYTSSNPFPAEGDFALEFNLTYTCLGDWGSGVWICDDPPTKDADKWTKSILIIGAGDEDPTRGKITIQLLGREIHRIYVPGGFKPSADPHILKLEYSQGNYTVYVDNIAVGSAQSQIRASVIGIGHPPCYYLPFSPQKVQEWGYWGWTAFNIDDIKVTTIKASESNVLFEDEFDGTQVDISKWLVTENTDMSGYPAWGGAINVKDGQIAFSSNGSTFPWVRTLNNPFPSVSDFAVELSLTYTIIGDSGNGVRIFSNQQNPNVYDSANNIFTLWAHDEGETTGVILIELFNKVVYKDYVPGFKPTSPVHTYRLEYANGNYTVYVDNRAVASIASQIRPTAIGLGHPPIPTLPYPPETTQTWAYWGWTSFNMDSIKVTATSNETPDENDSEPTTQPLNGNATLLVESNSTLSSIAFNSETNEASFTVTGPSGTTGYIRCIIPKTLLSNQNMLSLYLDGNKTTEYSVTEFSEDSWLLYFTYSHSSHTIMLGMQTPQTDFTVYGVIVAAAILGLLAAGVIVFARNLNK